MFKDESQFQKGVFSAIIIIVLNFDCASQPEVAGST